MDPWMILGWILVAAFTPVALLTVVLLLATLISITEGIYLERMRKRAERERVRERQERLRVDGEFDALLRDRDDS